MEDIESRLSEVDSGQFPSFSELIDLFRDLRKTKIRRPDLVIRHGSGLLNKVSESEYLPILEQLFTASLDLGYEDITKLCVQKLTTLFPKSTRVERLLGMLAEKTGDYPRALTIYSNLLKDQPANLTVMKRRVAVHRAAGNVNEAIEELDSIVKLFSFDISSWIELVHLYLSASELESAAHCMEEVILIEPMNAHYHCRLAEIYYSLGDYDNLMASRKHYTTSLTLLSPRVNFRALYGLMYCCKRLMEDKSEDIRQKQEVIGVSGINESSITEELFTFAKDNIDELIKN